MKRLRCSCRLMAPGPLMNARASVAGCYATRARKDIGRGAGWALSPPAGELDRADLRASFDAGDGAALRHDRKEAVAEILISHAGLSVPDLRRRDDGHRPIVLPRRPAGEDLHRPGREPDQGADLPRRVVGAGQVEDQPAAPGAERRAGL